MDPSAQTWQPYPQYPARPPMNGPAVASLVFGIVCCVPPLGLILGVIALRQIRRKGEQGKGLAVAGTVLSAISTLLTVLVIVTGGARGAWSDFRDGFEDGFEDEPTFFALEMKKGDCFTMSDDREWDMDWVDIVDCAEPHDGETSGRIRMKMSDAWPGDTDAAQLADERCQKANDAYARDGWILPSDLELHYYFPDEFEWQYGERTVVCGFVRASGQLDGGSVRADETNRSPHQLTYLRAENEVRAAMDDDPVPEYAEDPDAYRTWSVRNAKTLREQARSLRVYSWSDGSAAALKARAATFDRVAQQWDRAAAAKDEATFWKRFSRAETLLSARELEARGALDLTTAAPPEPGQV